MSKVVRVDDELAAWLEGYAKERGAAMSDVVSTALAGFKDDCERGVPELRRAAREQTYAARTVQGSGDCPQRAGDLPHEWGSGEERPCVYCGMPGRAAHDPARPQRGHLAQAAARRAEVFANLRTPDSIAGRKPK